MKELTEEEALTAYIFGEHADVIDEEVINEEVLDYAE